MKETAYISGMMVSGGAGGGQEQVLYINVFTPTLLVSRPVWTEKLIIYQSYFHVWDLVTFPKSQGLLERWLWRWTHGHQDACISLNAAFVRRNWLETSLECLIEFLTVYCLLLLLDRGMYDWGLRMIRQEWSSIHFRLFWLLHGMFA